MIKTKVMKKYSGIITVIALTERPVCCNRVMYPCGGVIGENPEQHWRCEVCGQELHYIEYIEIFNQLPR